MPSAIRRATAYNTGQRYLLLVINAKRKEQDREEYCQEIASRVNTRLVKCIKLPPKRRERRNSRNVVYEIHTEIAVPYRVAIIATFS